MLHQIIRRYAVPCALALLIAQANAEDADGEGAAGGDAAGGDKAGGESVEAGSRAGGKAANGAGVVYLYGGGNVGLAAQSETVVVGGRAYSDTTPLLFSHGRLGMEFSEVFSGEVRLGSGGGRKTIEYYYTDPIDFYTTRTSVDVGTLVLFFGGYVRAGIPTGSPIYPYALVGVTAGEMTVETSRASASFTDSGVSFGLGVDWKIRENVYINTEYTNYFSKDGIEISGFSAGIVLREPLPAGR